VTDLATDAPDTSTVLDAEPLGGPSGGGTPKLTPDEAPSLRDTVAEAMKEEPVAEKPDEGDDKAEGKEKEEKGAEKPKDEAKPVETPEAKKAAERAPDGKFAAKQAAEDIVSKDGDTNDVGHKPNGQHIEPPAKFLPDAKEKWLNVPRPVQRDVANMAREHEAEVTRYREAADRYEPIRQFDEVARQHGRAGAHESLAEVAHLEDMMGKNPLAALNQILLRAGPRKADGQPYSLFEVAQSVVQMGQQGYQQAVARTQQDNHQRGPDPEVAQLKAQLARMQEQTLTATVIEPFKREHPRYTELQDDIALFLQSGKIPPSLSPLEKLEAAYDMAARINPASHAPAPDPADLDPGDRAAPDLSGGKSIKSAPGAVSAELEPDRGGSISDLLRDEMKRRARS
jgi:hypothetical protein